MLSSSSSSSSSSFWLQSVCTIHFCTFLQSESSDRVAAFRPDEWLWAQWAVTWCQACLWLFVRWATAPPSVCVATRPDREVMEMMQGGWCLHLSYFSVVYPGVQVFPFVRWNKSKLNYMNIPIFFREIFIGIDFICVAVSCFTSTQTNSKIKKHWLRWWVKKWPDDLDLPSTGHAKTSLCGHKQKTRKNSLV